ncbi:hypothetical protein MPB2EB_0953 [Mycoavidus sp. B2-EB]|nr:hypothetical protein MPB2EB_0953 [Mycoavidus sp. B2-EB]
MRKTLRIYQQMACILPLYFATEPKRSFVLGPEARKPTIASRKPPTPLPILLLIHQPDSMINHANRNQRYFLFANGLLLPS